MTQSSLPKLIQLLKNNTNQWYTYQDIANNLKINVTNINKLVSELVSDEIVLKENTRPVKIKFNIDCQDERCLVSISGEEQSCGCDDSESRMNTDCCQVEAVVTVDKKGQIMLPKDFRERENINEGDKFTLVKVGGKGKNCCLILMSASLIEPMVKDALSPVMKIIIRNDEE